jgi:hypothetical protein
LLLNSFSSKDLALISSQDCDILPQLLPRIGLPSISDNKLFSLRTRTNGEPKFLEEATCRLKIVILLLCSFHSVRPTIASSTKGIDFIASLKLFRYDNIELLFKTPKLSEPEILSKNAVWGPPKLVAEDEKQTYSGSILLTKSVDDYIADLEELIVVYISGFVHFDSQNKNSLRAMKLLGHIESAEQFLKFLTRDFGKQFDFEIPVGDSTQTQVGEGDENTAVESIEALLRISFAAVRPKSSQQLSDKRSILSKDVDDEVNRAQKFMKTELEDASVIVSSEGRGRGRGVCILPAWMTQQETSLAGSVVLEQELRTVQGDVGSTSSTTPSGRGRGLSTLPAWMATQDKIDGSVHCEAVPSETNFEGVVSVSSTSSPTAHVEVDAAKMLPMAGRGRGVTILPAWMTAPTATGAIASSEPILQEVTDAMENALPPALVDNFLGSCLKQAMLQQEGTCSMEVPNSFEGVGKRVREEEVVDKGNVILNDLFSEKKSRVRFAFKESSHIKISDDTAALVSRFLSLLSLKGSSLDREMVLSLSCSRLVEAVVEYISEDNSEEQRSNGLIQELRDACFVLESKEK